LAQLGLPILLNSVIFKKSSIVIKGLMAIISQQLARGVTAKNVVSWIETLMDWVKKVEKSVVKKAEEATAKKDKQ
jgi:23S rRNA maturation mini-RNase III